MRSEIQTNAPRATLPVTEATFTRVAGTEVAADARTLLDRFLYVRQRTEALAAPLSAEDAQVSATGDTSPPKWHLAHTTWFFERMVLKAFGKGYKDFDPAYDFLFNSYYETVGAFLPKKRRPQISRPGLAEVLEYRREITARVELLLQEASGQELSRIRPVVELGLNHEEQHQELLLMDIKQNFFMNPQRPAYRPAPSLSPARAAEARFIERPGGKVEIGHQGEGFAYDNEGGRHSVWLEPYAISDRLVRCGEFLEFIEAGGYREPRLWLADGWDFLRAQKIEAPLYWEKKESGWEIFTLGGMHPLDAQAPVAHVSYYEAAAFAAWKGARLPTEFEWEAAAGPVLNPFTEKNAFLESGALEPREMLPEEGTLGQGCLWEWTGSAYLPYPRYRAYDDSLAEYNGKFMCNQMVLRGGSYGTPRAHYRPTYRNFYYPQMRWQFSGFRLARSL